ncbi:tRNA (cytosine(34)-C(5))-methyltransferase, mitochondrial [Spea bombifrons]|uniref:tRNA (cytosine(34)-C(5))-methyltransferase, mitochondrial n=1 Tax=Spea bombifrons TaxID=233779 RepID=UPI00234BFCF5|nr:tRNA (cytosine(34)-C(5))-methyltransferase, mitochondrial [Spea bombifrons]XP_053312837.1 tRNA (cytosine(34)-C(5))-methyltransferase, mitochondrial [Spea bombifrons]
MGRLQKRVCKLVLDYFEATYTKELGSIAWRKIREILTAPELWQYAVLLNNFTSPCEVEKRLHEKGYHLLLQEALSARPETLKCYVNKSPGKFPSQRHQFDRLKEYYILNASSLLPVLALDVRDGERVLDMCAAPGGKSIALLQCALPGYLHCNEADVHRSRRLKQTLESFVPKSHMNFITNFDVDGRSIGKLCPQMYDKVLVDAPCSNDRSWLFSSDAEQATTRILQRKTLPGIQTALLRSAIHALRPGGSLVYSTCTLSKAENSDVVANILNSCDDVIPVDLSDLGTALSHEFTFASGVRHGLLVLPDQGKSWGPMFVAKFRKKIQ